MKLTYLLSIFSALMILMLSVNMASAWIVDTHQYIHEKAYEQAKSSPVGVAIKDNWDAYIACSTMTDYSVFFYFQGQGTIGKVYLASHNSNICKRAIELASSPSQLACAYGVCSHEVTDEPSHDEYVPGVIRKTGLTNAVVHIFAEEYVNNQVKTPAIQREIRQALIQQLPVQRDFLIRVVQTQSGSQGIDVGNMIDTFVGQVAETNSWDVGFKSYSAVPFIIHAVILFIFFSSLFLIAILARKKNKNLFNKIALWVLSILAIIIVVLYILFLMGYAWRVFEFMAKPVGWVLPTGGWDSYVTESINNEVKFMNQGLSFVQTIDDPSGQAYLASADANGKVFRLALYVIFMGLLALFVWLNVRRKR